MSKIVQKPAVISSSLSRRRFVTGLTAGVGLAAANPLLARTLFDSNPRENVPVPVLRGTHFDLEIGYKAVNFTGVKRLATVVNQSLPAPVLHWREGDTVTIRVRNNLAEASSIHWHGIILPYQMDGVPGISFGGIKPGSYYDYKFTLNQSGTYWYHSHSGHQEQTGLYGAIVVEPREPDPVSYDRDYVILLSDWSDEDPDDIYRNLKIQAHYYNQNERTVTDLFRDIRNKGAIETWKDRLMWNQMRMNDRDISDVTGYTYTFLMNGRTPDQSWFGLFKKGEKIRLRFINGSAMTFFDVRLPGLKMRVVGSDGQNLEPVTVDDIRIGVAETYDVIVEPESDSAYTIFAQAIDRSGYACGTLAPDPSMKAPLPALDPVPVLTHADMGMSHSEHAGHATASSAPQDNHTDHGGHGSHGGQPSMDHSAHSNHNVSASRGLAPAGSGSKADIKHAPTEFGPQVDMRAENPQFRLDDPGIGLRDHHRLYGRKVLTYADLRNLDPTPDPRDPQREIQLHLTGNMYRYQWSFDGVPHSEASPIHFNYGERLRITLVNDTMMNHPVHLHGMWSDLETGDGDFIPRKHTVVVQPGAKISYLVTADALGDWAYHCHLLYHMHGMFREISVS